MSTIARFSLAEYDRMIERGSFEESRRIELIDGELREMSPIGPTHEEIVDILTLWSGDNLDREIVRHRIQNSIGLPNSDSAPQPDVAWVKQQRYANQRPTSADVFLVIEVSDSTLHFDEGEKARLYAQAGISEYWIVNIFHLCVDVYRDPVGETFQSVTRYDQTQIVSPLAFPDVTLDVQQLFDFPRQ